MTRHGEPISEVPLTSTLNTGIAISLYFESWEACIGAGLDLERWYNGGYKPDFMNKVIAWYRLHGLVEQHQADAQNRYIKKQQKRAGR